MRERFFVARKELTPGTVSNIYVFVDEHSGDYLPGGARPSLNRSPPEEMSHASGALRTARQSVDHKSKSILPQRAE